MTQLAELPAEADGVFEGGGVKGIAFAGALEVAERAGIRTWKNVAGTSAGAIVACLLAVGYGAADLKRILDGTEYRRFADYGFGGVARGVVNSFWKRGLAPGRYAMDWLGEQIAASPLAEAKGKTELTFGDVVRDDLPEGLPPEARRRARYRLRLIASDVSGGRMLVLPDAISLFARERGDRTPREPDELGLLEAVRMSMSIPYLFEPVRLWSREEKQRPHDVVDGAVLSNFPVWLFDSGPGRAPARPTWGFRLHAGTAAEEASVYHPVTMPFWRSKLFAAIFLSAMEAWDRDQLDRVTSVRTVSIPTGAIATADFNLRPEAAEWLFHSGREAAERFFTHEATRTYLEAFERRRREATPAGG